ncbi:hypothetical protein [Streptomyces broussonetiae]|uniref:Uncharacterized protein n=1 Tax=Streptomyces broussonetiae TaxID=2686304 RepID=A0A6I6MZW8_9ACTN|nr:hypothetical protein [Streptomyces broussonetiae]QHA02567.1 hypothetical protein GQF42_04025 [Streptomyces broussonetiae]
MVGDDLVSGIWYLGRMLEREGDAVRAAPKSCRPRPPCPDGADFRHLTGEGGWCARHAYPDRLLHVLRDPARRGLRDLPPHE